MISISVTIIWQYASFCLFQASLVHSLLFPSSVSSIFIPNSSAVAPAFYYLFLELELYSSFLHQIPFFFLFWPNYFPWGYSQGISSELVSTSKRENMAFDLGNQITSLSIVFLFLSSYPRIFDLNGNKGQLCQWVHDSFGSYNACFLQRIPYLCLQWIQSHCMWGCDTNVHLYLSISKGPMDHTFDQLWNSVLIISTANRCSLLRVERLIYDE